jgi:ubiquinone biosynthesis protein Coq4
MMNIINRLRLLRAQARIMQDPTRTEEVFRIARLSRSVYPARVIEGMLSYMAGIPEFKRLYDEHYTPKLPTLEQLKECPSGSLGRAYYDHLAPEGLRPDFYPTEPGDDFLAYVITRSRQTHDFVHVITGYGTSLQHELAVQGFMLSQLRASLPVSLIFAGLMYTLRHNPGDLLATMDCIVEGYLRGCKAKCIMAMRLEEMLNVPLAEVRRQAGMWDVEIKFKGA